MIRNRTISLYFIYAIIIALLFAGCKNKRESLTLLDRKLLIRLHQKEQFSIHDAVILNCNGQPITQREVSLIRERKLAARFYVNARDIMTEVRMCPTSYEDRITSILINDCQKNPAQDLPTIPINCDSLRYNISDLYKVKKEDIKGIVGIDTLSFFDFETVKVVSIVKTCGFPSLNSVGHQGLKTFWLMIQHNPDIISHYYLEFEELVKEGELKAGVFALMTDRLLMNNNYPQVFGSQILNSELYEIENRDSVDYRRAAIGLEPLNEYLKNFDLN